MISMTQPMRHIRPYMCMIALFIACALHLSTGFTAPSSASLLGGIRVSQRSIVAALSSLSSSPLSEESQQTCDWSKVTEEWELDCYSRPVLVDGKKKIMGGFDDGFVGKFEGPSCVAIEQGKLS
mmetsp:Transcript_2577/g.5873  ORF Transcript_2577/g.5873 Transcript_2577/m.5873 type:complete len:124 (-) Transcript_2577:1155-1526(-)